MRFGISHFAPSLFNAPPDLAVSGPNVGTNLGPAIFFSGTAGAASYAANKEEVPALAFSGASGSPTAWNASSTYPLTSRVYAELAANVTDRIVQAGMPYLPAGVFLNVNFPEVSKSECSRAADTQFVLSRIFGSLSDDDVETCGSRRLPGETSVVHTDGCYASISVGLADTKTDANATMQRVVLDKLGDFLTCLP